jgi:hypothetical protein
MHPKMNVYFWTRAKIIRKRPKKEYGTTEEPKILNFYAQQSTSISIDQQKLGIQKNG